MSECDDSSFDSETDELDNSFGNISERMAPRYKSSLREYSELKIPSFRCMNTTFRELNSSKRVNEPFNEINRSFQIKDPLENEYDYDKYGELNTYKNQEEFTPISDQNLSLQRSHNEGDRMITQESVQKFEEDRLITQESTFQKQNLKIFDPLNKHNKEPNSDRSDQENTIVSQTVVSDTESISQSEQEMNQIITYRKSKFSFIEPQKAMIMATDRFQSAIYSECLVPLKKLLLRCSERDFEKLTKLNRLKAMNSINKYHSSQSIGDQGSNLFVDKIKKLERDILHNQNLKEEHSSNSLNEENNLNKLGMQRQHNIPQKCISFSKKDIIFWSVIIIMFCISMLSQLYIMEEIYIISDTTQDLQIPILEAYSFLLKEYTKLGLSQHKLIPDYQMIDMNYFKRNKQVLEEYKLGLMGDSRYGLLLFYGYDNSISSNILNNFKRFSINLNTNTVPNNWSQENERIRKMIQSDNLHLDKLEKFITGRNRDIGDNFISTTINDLIIGLSSLYQRIFFLENEIYDRIEESWLFFVLILLIETLFGVLTGIIYYKRALKLLREKSLTIKIFLSIKRHRFDTLSTKYSRLLFILSNWKKQNDVRDQKLSKKTNQMNKKTVISKQTDIVARSYNDNPKKSIIGAKSKTKYKATTNHNGNLKIKCYLLLLILPFTVVIISLGLHLLIIPYLLEAIKSRNNIYVIKNTVYTQLSLKYLRPLKNVYFSNDSMIQKLEQNIQEFTLDTKESLKFLRSSVFQRYYQDMDSICRKQYSTTLEDEGQIIYLETQKEQCTYFESNNEFSIHLAQHALEHYMNQLDEVEDMGQYLRSSYPSFIKYDFLSSYFVVYLDNALTDSKPLIHFYTDILAYRSFTSILTQGLVYFGTMIILEYCMVQSIKKKIFALEMALLILPKQIMLRNPLIKNLMFKKKHKL